MTVRKWCGQSTEKIEIMSFIDPVRNLAFTHIAKTSGAIWAEWIWKFRKDLIGFGAHDSLTIMRKHNPAAFGKCFKVGFVRNPWSWWVSAYFWFNEPRHKGFDFLQRYPTFKDFITHRHEWQPPFPYLYQWPFLCETGNRHAMIADFVGRTEQTQEDFNHICRQVGVEPWVLSTKPHRDYRPYYDKETIDLVAKISAQDIELFGYTFGEEFAP